MVQDRSSIHRVITPPGIVETPHPVIFLAGPIQGAPDWQTAAIRILDVSEISFSIANPRKRYAPGAFGYEQQVDWETEYLRRAGRSGVVLFWLAKQAHTTPDRPYAQTSRFELGEWMARSSLEGANIAIGIEDGFTNERYIRRRFSQELPETAVRSDLEQVCADALRSVRP